MKTISERVEQAFSPTIALRHRRGTYGPDLVSQWRLVQQIAAEALGAGHSAYLKESELGAFMAVATSDGFSTTILVTEGADLGSHPEKSGDRAVCPAAPSVRTN